MSIDPRNERSGIARIQGKQYCCLAESVGLAQMILQKVVR